MALPGPCVCRVHNALHIPAWLLKWQPACRSARAARLLTNGPLRRRSPSFVGESLPALSANSPAWLWGRFRPVRWTASSSSAALVLRRPSSAALDPRCPAGRPLRQAASQSRRGPLPHQPGRAELRPGRAPRPLWPRRSGPRPRRTNARGSPRCEALFRDRRLLGS